MKVKKHKCLKCGGSGRVESLKDRAEKMRQFREKSGHSLRAVASEMHVSAAHLSMMERGTRTWAAHQPPAFFAAIRKLAQSVKLKAAKQNDKLTHGGPTNEH